MTTFPHVAAKEAAISTNPRQELMDESATPPTKE
jgi:hypothetical protein